MEKMDLISKNLKKVANMERCILEKNEELDWWTKRKKLVESTKNQTEVKDTYEIVDEVEKIKKLNFTPYNYEKETYDCSHPICIKQKELKNNYETDCKKVKPPVKEEIRNALFTGILFAVIILAFLTFFFVKYNKQKPIAIQNEIVEDIISNPSIEWDNWTDTWKGLSYGNSVNGYPITENDWLILEEQWQYVQSAWNERGLNVSWELVNESKHSLGVDKINYDRTVRKIFANIESTYKNTDTDISSVNVYLAFGIISIIGLAICIGITVSVAIKRYRRNKYYNDKYIPLFNELYSLINEYLDYEYPLIIAGIENLQTQIDTVYKELKDSKHILKYDYYEIPISLDSCNFDSHIEKLEHIAKIIDDGRADDLKTAVDIYEEEERKREKRRNRWLANIQAETDALRTQNELRQQAEQAEERRIRLEQQQHLKEIEQQEEIKRLSKKVDKLTSKQPFEPNLAKCAVCKYKNSCTRTRCHYIYKG